MILSCRIRHALRRRLIVIVMPAVNICIPGSLPKPVSLSVLHRGESL